MTWRGRIQGDNAVGRSEALKSALEGFQTGLWTALPGILQSINLTAMTCEVQPALLIPRRIPDGSVVLDRLPLLRDCPILYPGGGGFTLTFPLAVGDEVLVIFACRCIDSWWQNGDVQPPSEFRVHDLSDGFAMPGVRSQPRVIANGIHATAVQLRSDDGNVYFEFDPATNKARLNAPIIELESTSAQTSIVSKGDTTVAASGKVSINAQGGDVTVVASGNINLN